MGIFRITVVAALFAFAGSAFAQGPAAKPPTESSTVLATWSMIEKDFTSAADAMPEDKYSFAPSAGEFKGARTFAEQVKHVAAVNYIFGASVLQEKPPVDR